MVFETRDGRRVHLLLSFSLYPLYSFSSRLVLPFFCSLRRYFRSDESGAAGPMRKSTASNVRSVSKLAAGGITKDDVSFLNSP